MGRKYIKPEIEKVVLDSDISLVMQSFDSGDYDNGNHKNHGNHWGERKDGFNSDNPFER